MAMTREAWQNAQLFNSKVGVYFRGGLFRCQDNIPNSIIPNALIPNSKIPNVPKYPIPKYSMPNYPMPLYPIKLYPMPNYPIDNLIAIILKLRYNPTIRVPVYH